MVTSHKNQHPFYGKEIIRRTEQERIDDILKKYKNEAVTEALQEKIWNELQMERYLGHITIPFKIAMRRDANKKHPDYIEIILDTKV
jgi:hypothetical protein